MSEVETSGRKPLGGAFVACLEESHHMQVVADPVSMRASRNQISMSLAHQVDTRAGMVHSQFMCSSRLGV